MQTCIFYEVSKYRYLSAAMSLWKPVRKTPESDASRADAIGVWSYMQVINWKNLSSSLGNKMVESSNIMFYPNIHCLPLFGGFNLRLNNTTDAVILQRILIFTSELQTTDSMFLLHDDVIKWNIFRVTGPLWGESTGHRWIPSQTPVTQSFDVFFDLRMNQR